MDGKRLFLLRNLTIYPTLWELLTANNRMQHAPREKRELRKDLPVVEILWIFPLQFIEIVGGFRAHRLKAYIPAVFEARTLLYGSKRLG